MDTASLWSPDPNCLVGVEGIEGARGVSLGIDWDSAAADADSVTQGLVKDAVSVLAELGLRSRPVHRGSAGACDAAARSETRRVA
jgi:amidase